MKRNQLLALVIALCTALPCLAQKTKKLYVPKAGTMVELLTEEEANEITHLRLMGKLNAVDFRHLRDEFKQLRSLDISQASISLYAGKNGTWEGFRIYPANSLPPFAFCKQKDDHTYVGKETLVRVILPPGLKEIEGEPTAVKVQISRMGSLASELIQMGVQPNAINFLTVEGKLDEADFTLIRDYMPNLVYIDMKNSNATAIPEYTFTQKKFLLKVLLPKRLESIGQRAFSGCTRLCGTLVLPPTLTAIEFGAFIGCDNLRRVVATGNNLTALGDKLFGEEENRIVYQ